MAVLWIGGEDIDFPSGAGTMFVSNSGYRAAYARCSIINNVASPLSSFLLSNPFPGGALTTAWITYRMNLGGITFGTNRLYLGFGLSGTSKGVFPGIDTATSGKLALHKYDGTTRTQLAAESGTSLATGVTHRLDMQVINYGASSTVNIYLNTALLITFTGDISVSGMTNFNVAAIPGYNSPSYSEIAVTDEDPRSWMGIATLALTGAGATNNWTNSTFTNINSTTLSDVNPTYSNADGLVQSYNVTDLPAGTFSIRAVKISARIAQSTTPAVTKIQLGYNNGSGSSASGTGSIKTAPPAYATFEQLDLTNPITASPWVQSDMNSLQLELTSKT